MSVRSLVAAPDRAEAIARARSQGLRVIAALPYHLPHALLRAHGFHAVQVWSPPPRRPGSTPMDPVPIRSAGPTGAGSGGTCSAGPAGAISAGARVAGSGAAHFQAYACSIVTAGASFLLDTGFEGLDAVLVPHGCDALQGLGSVFTDFVGERPPVLTLYPPRARRPVDRAYLVAELRHLGERLSEISGVRPDEAAWREAVAVEEAADAAQAELYRRRAELAARGLRDKDFYALVRSREYLLAEDVVDLIAATLSGGPLGSRGSDAGAGSLGAGASVSVGASSVGASVDSTRSARPAGSRAHAGADAHPRGTGVPIVLSGIVAEPDLLDALADAGARVVSDDLGCGSRRLLPTSDLPDPIERWADAFLRGPADPTRADPIADRVDRLRHLVESSGGRGVLIVDPPFCEPEQFYLPSLRKALAGMGVPMLFVEAETVDARVITRIEAFVETLS